MDRDALVKENRMLNDDLLRLQVENERLKHKLKSIQESMEYKAENVYHEEVFLPVSSEEYKFVNRLLKLFWKRPIDALSGAIGRHTLKWITRDVIEIIERDESEEME